MVRSIKQGKTERMSYSRIDEVIEVPNLIEIQKDSYDWFMNEGIYEVFQEISPITDSQGLWEVWFMDREFDAENPICGLDECKEKDSNYAAPLRINLRLRNTQTGEIKDSPAYVGDFPIMTDHGTFIINGAERVIISQIVRSPGAYFGTAYGKLGKLEYTSQIIPNRGAWLELEEDENGVISVRVDRARKFPLTIFLRALGLNSNEEILETFGDEEGLRVTMEKDSCKNRADSLAEFYKKVRPGEPVSVEAAENHLNALFFDSRRYDLARVGIYKINKKLSLAARIAGHKAAEDIISLDGELLLKKDEIISKEKAQEIEDSGISAITVFPITKIGDTVKISEQPLRVIGNGRVDAQKFIEASFAKKDIKDFDITATKINERVIGKVLREIVTDIRENAKKTEYAQKLTLALN